MIILKLTQTHSINGKTTDKTKCTKTNDNIIGNTKTDLKTSDNASFIRCSRCGQKIAKSKMAWTSTQISILHWIYRNVVELRSIANGQTNLRRNGKKEQFQSFLFQKEGDIYILSYEFWKHEGNSRMIY